MLQLPDASLLGTAPIGGAGNAGSVYRLKVSSAAAIPELRLTVSPAQIALGGSARFYWASIGASTCTAGGAWTGTRHATGTGAVTPAAVGSYSYQLTCNIKGGTATATASLVAVSPGQPAAPSVRFAKD